MTPEPSPERARPLPIGGVAGGVLVLVAAARFALRAGQTPPARHAHSEDLGAIVTVAAGQGG